jgi:ABC-type multidrug transport system ATPase subunit
MIEARGLVKRYRSALAVNSLSFDVRPGTVTGFLGPNGAGKTTTIGLLLGFIRPTVGRAEIFGANCQSPVRIRAPGLALAAFGVRLPFASRADYP